MDRKHQWLANRGYAVLSDNFRGSGSFGKKFQNAGKGEWSQKLQDDLIDAVNWAIKNKIAHSRKISIMGASYGVYATLAGLTFTNNIIKPLLIIQGANDLVVKQIESNKMVE